MNQDEYIHTLNTLQILLKKKPITNDGKRNIIGALHLGIYNECGHYNFNYTHDMYCDKNVKYFESLRPLLQKMAKQYEADYPGYYKKIVSKAMNFGLPIELPSYPFPFIVSNIYTQNTIPKWHKDNMDKKDFPTMDLAYGNYGECRLQMKNIRLYNGSKIISKEEYINEKMYSFNFESNSLGYILSKNASHRCGRLSKNEWRGSIVLPIHNMYMLNNKQKYNGPSWNDMLKLLCEKNCSCKTFHPNMDNVSDYIKDNIKFLQEEEKKECNKKSENNNNANILNFY